MTPQHPPKVKYTGTVTVNEQQHEMPTSKPCNHGRKCHRGKPAHREEEGQVANRSVELQSFQVDTKGATSMGGRQSMLPHQISTPSQSEIKFNQITIIVALLPGPAHPPKVKFQVFCQNVHTTSHRRIKILTTSALRAISSATKTHRTLSKPPLPRSFPGQRSTLSFTNLAQSRSAVWRTFLNFILTVLIDLALSRESMTSRLTQQCHQYSMRGGRCQ